jgi:PAS domain S-box-containing protein
VYAAIARNSTWHGEYPQKRMDGSTGWFDFNISALAGQPDTVVATIIDATPWHQSLARLQFQAEILASIRDGVNVVSTSDGIIRYTNAAFDAMLGYAEGELLGQDIAIVNAETDRPPQDIAQEIMAELLRTGEWLGEILNRRKDGTTFCSSLKITTHESAEWGTVWISVLRDITAQRKAQNILRASEERYRTLVETVSVVTWVCPPSGLQDEPQPLWMAFTGQTAAEMLGAGWTRAVHPDDAAAAAARWQAAVERGEPFSNLHRIRRHDGAWRWMNVRAVPIRDSQGQIVEWMGMNQDITERRQAELALAESEKRLELALAGSGLALWDWDLAAAQIIFGQRWYDMLGYPPETAPLNVEHWKRLFEPNDLKRVEAAVAAYLAGDTPVLHSVHRVRHKDGHWVTVEATGKIIQRDDAGQPLRLVGTVHDVSQKKRLNEEGVELLKRIEALIQGATSGAPRTLEKSELAESLTRRQREILALIASGMTSAQIGKQLNLATPTVVSHRRNLMSKLGLHSAAELTRFALEHGLLKEA